ncbi:MAG TPA: hypothetical protein VII90_10825 [Anaerolineales bacterium]
MKFDVYGRFIVEVIRHGEDWEVFLLEQGRRLRMDEVAIQSETPMDRIPYYLEDLWHESASPGKAIRRLD